MWHANDANGFKWIRGIGEYARVLEQVDRHV